MTGFRVLTLYLGLRLRCVLGGHLWMKARRTLGTTGERRCRRCGVKEAVTLKPRYQSKFTPLSPNDS